jgi:hypothetical protein
MRKVLLAAVLVAAIAPVAVADEGLDQYIELLRSDINTEIVGVITEVMHFSKDEADAFWPIYREYEVERAKLGDERIALIRDYAENFDTMTDMKAKELVDRSFKLQDKRMKLAKKYHAKVEKATSPMTAARFSQLMNQIQLLIDVQIAAEMPLLEKPE